MGRGKRSRSMLAQKAQTIEELWESVSRAKSADLNPPPSKIVLTPRSAEACLRHGLNPEILRIRPLDSFDVNGVDPTVQRLRHETYTQRRSEMMRLVRAERKRLITQEAREAEMASSGVGTTATITPQQLIAAQAKQNATFLEQEEARMRKMEARQDKELEQMMAFEIKMGEIQRERDAKAEAAQRKEDAKRRAKERAARKRGEDNRLREAKRQATEEAEEAQRMAVTRNMFEKERELRAQRMRQEKTLRKKARAKEEERLRKQEEHRLQTQRILAAQTNAVKRRMKEMELAEQERTALVEKKQAEDRHRKQLRRAQMEARISRNMAQAAKMEEKRKEHFFEKKAHHESLRQEQLELMERERQLHVHQNELQEQRLKMILAATRRKEEERKEDLLATFELQEEAVNRVREARAGSNVVAQEKHRLRLQMKLENVERIKRIAEYRRLETLRGIHEADRRTQEMISRREMTIQTRKANAVIVKRKKDQLMEVMERARSDANNAEKILATIGIGPKAKGKKKLPPMEDSARALGPPPEGSLSHVSRQEQTPQLPYVSPYEGEGAQTVTF